MSKKQPFKPHSAEKQKEYERELRLEFGPTLVNESINRWNSYSKAQQEIVFEEAGEIYMDMVAALKAGVAPQSQEVQQILERWHENLRYFYEPTLEILRGLGEMYNTHPGFIANFRKMHTGLPEYLQAGIMQYVDDLEYAEIERLLAQDEENRASQ